MCIRAKDLKSQLHMTRFYTLTRRRFLHPSPFSYLSNLIPSLDIASFLILDLADFCFCDSNIFLHLVAIKYHSKTDILYQNMISNDNFFVHINLLQWFQNIFAIYPSHLACKYTFHETRVGIWSHRIWQTEFKNIVENSPRALSH